jgi:MbtH protein
MNRDSTDEDRVYHAVVNGEEQYSIWPADRELPRGWREAGMSGSRQQCLDYISRIWTDMRPLSLRGQGQAPDSPPGQGRSERSGSN